FEAVARTWSLATVSPTLTVTLATLQVPSPPAAFSGTSPVVGPAPNVSDHAVEEAIEPVAATSSATSAIAAAAVRNDVAADAFDGKPPSPTKTAPPPTTSRTAITTSLSLIDAPTCGAATTRPTRGASGGVL